MVTPTVEMISQAQTEKPLLPDWYSFWSQKFKQQSLVRNLAGEEAQWQHLPRLSTWPKPQHHLHNIPPSNTGQNLGIGNEMYLHNTVYGFQNIQTNFYITVPDKQNCICFNKAKCKGIQSIYRSDTEGRGISTINKPGVKLASTTTLTTGFQLSVIPRF